MAASISSSAWKRLASLAARSGPKHHVPGTRQLHSSGAKQMGGSHGGHDAYDDYLHAENMYNIPAMKNRTLKMGLSVFGVVAIGTAVPIVAVIFQQKKAKIM